MFSASRGAETRSGSLIASFPQARNLNLPLTFEESSRSLEDTIRTRAVPWTRGKGNPTCGKDLPLEILRGGYPREPSPSAAMPPSAVDPVLRGLRRRERLGPCTSLYTALLHGGTSKKILPVLGYPTRTSGIVLRGTCDVEENY